MFPTGRCHIRLFPVKKYAHCDAAFRQPGREFQTVEPATEKAKRHEQPNLGLS